MGFATSEGAVQRGKGFLRDLRGEELLLVHSTLRKGDIMNRTKTWLVMLASLCLLLAACNKKEETGESAGAPASTPAAAPAATPIDTATAANVSGTVKLDGAAPKAARIDMSQDPACKGDNTAETF